MNNKKKKAKIDFVRSLSFFQRKGYLHHYITNLFFCFLFAK